jgi:hypothetical protein
VVACTPDSGLSGHGGDPADDVARRVADLADLDADRVLLGPFARRVQEPLDQPGSPTSPAASRLT